MLRPLVCCTYPTHGIFHPVAFFFLRPNQFLGEALSSQTEEHPRKKLMRLYYCGTRRLHSKNIYDYDKMSPGGSEGKSFVETSAAVLRSVRNQCANIETSIYYFCRVEYVDHGNSYSVGGNVSWLCA